MTRSSLETQRLELFSEISNLKLHQAAYERENIELREKIRRADHHADHAKMQVSVINTIFFANVPRVCVCFMMCLLRSLGLWCCLQCMIWN